MFDQQVAQLLRPMIAGRDLCQHDLHHDELCIDALVRRGRSPV
jgi:hypothetical protein